MECTPRLLAGRGVQAEHLPIHLLGGAGVSYSRRAALHNRLSDLMTAILALDHAEVDALFGDLSPAFASGIAREVFEKLDYLWARLAVHIRAEHLHLFPALLAASAACVGVEVGGAPAEEEARAVVERLREDHDFFMRELAGAVNASRELASRGGLADRERLLQIEGRVCAVVTRLAEHNRVEEEQVYRWPDALLSGAQLVLLSAEMEREIRNLPPRFCDEERG